jgi:hypothetical protein
MPTSTLARKYTINGVVNTENPVMENLDGICRSAGSFLTYDVHQGLWSVVINTTASSVYSFDDSNIVGPIQVSTTSLFDLYNEVEVEFPLLDTADKTDFVRLEIPDANRAPYEQDNQLKMTLNFASEPVQASLLGRIELLQSRLDKVVTFESDYSALQLNAGDVIDVTNALYGFTGKTFRIITIKELDADDGSIRCEITALEYDATIYSAANLTRTVRSDLTGIQTLGAIGVPGTPTFVKSEASARPQINVVTTVPTGVIEGVECWISSDGTNYQLRNTIKNADTVLTPGASLTFEFDDQAAGNVYAKTRGTNYSVAGPFSNVGNTTYTPKQITDAIGNSTSILDGSGGTIATLLALPVLLDALDAFMNGNPNLTTSLQQVAVGGPLIYQIENDTGVTTGGAPGGLGLSTEMVTPSTITFTIPQTGYYTLDCSVNFAAAGAGTDSSRGIYVYTFTGNTYGTGNVIANLTPQTSTSNVDVFSDLYMSQGGTVNAGNYHLEFWYYTQAANFMNWSINILGPWPNSGSQTI